MYLVISDGKVIYKGTDIDKAYKIYHDCEDGRVTMYGVTHQIIEYKDNEGYSTTTST